ncbi:MAG: hypothetical protein ILP02_03010, partial [Clostridia bacterium]|nr:hypothetical protein [Clostridia bacterium]
MFGSFIRSGAGKAFITVCSILLALTIIVNVLALTVLNDMAMLVLGSPKPIYDKTVAMMYLPDTNSKKEAYDNAARINIEVCKEGFVL